MARSIDGSVAIPPQQLVGDGSTHGQWRGRQWQGRSSGGGDDNENHWFAWWLARLLLPLQFYRDSSLETAKHTGSGRGGSRRGGAVAVAMTTKITGLLGGSLDCCFRCTSPATARWRRLNTLTVAGATVAGAAVTGVDQWRCRWPRKSLVCLVARSIGSVAVWWPATSKSRRELAVVAVEGRSSGGGGGVEKHWFNSFGWSIQFSFAVGSEHVAMVARSIGSVVVWLSRLLFFTSKG